MNVKTLYVIPTARYSIGGTQHPYEEKEAQRRILDAILSAESDDADLRWTCSSASVVSDYLRSSDEMTKKRALLRSAASVTTIRHSCRT